jgi:hypothetical protein
VVQTAPAAAAANNQDSQAVQDRMEEKQLP